MANYLPTPHSIAISSLIALYADPYSPLYPYSQTNNGWPTRILSLIQELVREDDGYIFDERKEENVLVDLLNCSDTAISTRLEKTCNKKNFVGGNNSVRLHTEPLSVLLTRIDQAYSSARVIDLTATRTSPSTALLERLQTATSSIEHLSQLIDDFHALLEGAGISYSTANRATIGIDGDSSFGIYLRKVCLGMEELSFEALSRLWVCFGQFVSEAVEDRSASDDCEKWLPSSSQVESIVKKTCLKVDLNGNNFVANESSSNRTQDIREQTVKGADLLRTHPETPSLHFLLFYSSLLQNERCATLESLHRYFDYGMIHDRKERAERSLAGTTTGGNANSIVSGPTGGITTSVNIESQRRPNPNNNNNSNPKRYKESNIMQYAAILLAQTYHRFNYKSLALQATQEAIRVAQQSNDEECVLFAQGWLAYIKDNDFNMLRRCRDRAIERGLGNLAAGATLELGRREGYMRIERRDDELENGEDEICLAWESIQNAGRAVVSSGGVAGFMSGSSTGRGGFGRQNVTDVENMTCNEALSILGRQNMAISGLWDSTGHTSMASLSSCSALHGYTSELASEDAASAMRRIIMSFSYGPGLDVWTAETTGATNLKQRESVYAASLNLLSSLHSRDLSSEWVQSTVLILHEWSVRLHDLNIARSLQCFLANHAAFPSNPITAIEMNLVSLSRSAHLYLQVGDYSTAKVATRRACMIAAKHSLLIHRGWQLLQLALIDLESSTGAPSDNPSVERALSPLLKCLDLADKHNMDPLRAAALATMAKILLYLGQFQRARAMLKSAMPLILQHGHKWFQGEACLTMAKCNLVDARSIVDETQTATKTTDSLEKLRRTALSQLENAASIFEQIDDNQRLRQTCYLQAVVCNFIPRLQSRRDELANQFSQLTMKRQIGSRLWNAVHGIMIGDLTRLQT